VGRLGCRRVRAETRETLALAGKTILFSLGGLLVVAALVDLVVGGLSWTAAGVLATGLVLAGLPLGFALRDALRHAQKR